MSLSHAEQSRTIAHHGRLASLSTWAVDPDGFPYGSLVQYALTSQGNPLLLISDLAEHTQNLRQDGRASLLIWQNQSHQDPLAAGRVTLLGRAQLAPPEELNNYLEVHPQASLYASFKDFHLWQLQIERVRYVGGFGEMSWVSGFDYARAEVDPVAALAEGIIRHMNEDHLDAMILLASKKLGSPVLKAEMVACDGAGYRLRVDGGKSLHIPFSRRLRNSNEVRKEFVEQVGNARGH